MRKIKTAAWRDDSNGPMQVVSGPVGNEHVHFEAPHADRLEGEMGSFLGWFEGGDPIDPVLKAGLAHLWFATIHPFEDGNGRIARAIADMSLARSENSPQRFYSMSAQIRQESKAYYDILENSQLRHSRETTHPCSPKVSHPDRCATRRFVCSGHAARAADDIVTPTGNGNRRLTRLRRG